jgi:RNA polymerase sigma-70 factor, ECF subfamily
VDAGTVRALAEGDHSAVNEVLTVVMQWLRRKAGHYLRTEDLEDIAIDAVERAAAAADGYRGDAQPATWLIAIAAHALGDEIRRRRRHAPFAGSLDQVQNDVEDGACVERMATDRVAAALAVEGLTADQQEAIRLTVVAELTSAEAGERMGIPAATVRSLLSRGLQKARAVLSELGEDQPPRSEVRDGEPNQ